MFHARANIRNIFGQGANDFFTYRNNVRDNIFSHVIPKNWPISLISAAAKAKVTFVSA